MARSGPQRPRMGGPVRAAASKAAISSGPVVAAVEPNVAPLEVGDGGALQALLADKPATELFGRLRVEVCRLDRAVLLLPQVSDGRLDLRRGDVGNCLEGGKVDDAQDA